MTGAVQLHPLQAVPGLACKAQARVKQLQFPPEQWPQTCGEDPEKPVPQNGCCRKLPQNITRSPVRNKKVPAVVLYRPPPGPLWWKSCALPWKAARWDSMLASFAATVRKYLDATHNATASPPQFGCITCVLHFCRCESQHGLTVSVWSTCRRTHRHRLNWFSDVRDRYSGCNDKS